MLNFSVTIVMNTPKKQLDLRVLLLSLFCLILTCFSNATNRDDLRDISVPVDQHVLQWANQSFSLTTKTDYASVTKIPAGVSPFFFEKFNINEADSALLQIIPGIGPEFANRIISERNKKARFSDPDQLLEIPGIGQKRREILMEWLTIE